MAHVLAVVAEEGSIATEPPVDVADRAQRLQDALQSARPGGPRQGGGRALLNAVLDHARDGDAHKVDLEVWPDNARAIALYGQQDSLSKVCDATITGVATARYVLR